MIGEKYGDKCFKYFIVSGNYKNGYKWFTHSYKFRKDPVPGIRKSSFHKFKIPKFKNVLTEILFDKEFRIKLKNRYLDIQFDSGENRYFSKFNYDNGWKSQCKKRKQWMK